MPEEKNLESTVEKKPEDIQNELDALYNEVNKRWHWEKWEREKAEDLEKQLEDLKKWISKESKESLNMSKDEAIKYLESIKDKSWGDLNKEGRKWIAAVQVVLKDKGYSVWKIDWYLGRRRSKTRTAIREFQRSAGLKLVDGKPWKQTINALLGKKVDNNDQSKNKTDGGSQSKESSVTYWTGKDKDWNTFDWEYKDGKPWNGTYTATDGTKYQFKDWEPV